MCKYCKLENGVRGEYFNNNQTLGSLKDGNYIVEVAVNRYINEDSGTHSSDLIVETAVKTHEGVQTVKQKFIKIKYCPNCGEKL